jgi:hypothetical protein
VAATLAPAAASAGAASVPAGCTLRIAEVRVCPAVVVGTATAATTAAATVCLSLCIASSALGVGVRAGLVEGRLCLYPCPCPSVSVVHCRVVCPVAAPLPLLLHMAVVPAAWPCSAGSICPATPWPSSGSRRCCCAVGITAAAGAVAAPVSAAATAASCFLIFIVISVVHSMAACPAAAVLRPGAAAGAVERRVLVAAPAASSGARVVVALPRPACSPLSPASIAITSLLCLIPVLVPLTHVAVAAGGTALPAAAQPAAAAARMLLHCVRCRCRLATPQSRTATPCRAASGTGVGGSCGKRRPRSRRAGRCPPRKPASPCPKVPRLRLLAQGRGVLLLLLRAPLQILLPRCPLTLTLTLLAVRSAAAVPAAMSELRGACGRRCRRRLRLPPPPPAIRAPALPVSVLRRELQQIVNRR